jgi:hypothetical protein
MTSRIFIHYRPIVTICTFMCVCFFRLISCLTVLMGKHFRNWPFARPRRLRAGRQEAVFRFQVDARIFSSLLRLHRLWGETILLFSGSSWPFTSSNTLVKDEWGYSFTMTVWWTPRTSPPCSRGCFIVHIPPPHKYADRVATEVGAENNAVCDMTRMQLVVAGSFKQRIHTQY